MRLVRIAKGLRAEPFPHPTAPCYNSLKQLAARTMPKSKKPAKPAPGHIVCLSDIHGSILQFRKFVRWVKGSGAKLILLGDYVDRGKNSGDCEKVLKLVKALQETPEKYGIESCVPILGNHEILALGAFEGNPAAMRDWVMNGGDIANIYKLRKFEPWLRGLPYYVIEDGVLFSHAGTFPSHHPEEYMGSESLKEAFVWNRGSFLKKGPCFKEWDSSLRLAVMGHTPQGSEPYFGPDFVCIDTGCFFTGVLTAYDVTADRFVRFGEDSVEEWVPE